MDDDSTTGVIMDPVDLAVTGASVPNIDLYRYNTVSFWLAIAAGTLVFLTGVSILLLRPAKERSQD